jgi:TonB family protein
MMSSAMPAYVYEVPQRKNHRVFVRSVVRFSLYVTLAILSQVAELLAGGGQPLPNSALHWPKSSKYDTPPKLVSGNYPVYPISQLRFNKSGFAVVAFTVGRDGRTYDIHVLRASYPYFGSHTVLAVRDWKFEPARKNGQPVAATIKLVMPFKVG